MGIESERDYPYTSGGGSTGSCKFQSSKIAVSISGYHSVSRGESALKQALNAGPASVCLAASSWQSYSGGILSRCDNQVDHCVQATGYSGSSYWRIRNSWGTGWVGSSTLLMPSLMWLEGRRGPSPFQEPCQEWETLLPSRLGSSSSSNISTLSPSGLLLQEEQRGPSPSLEPSLSFPLRATHRLRLNGTGLFKLTRLSSLPMNHSLLEGRRGPTLLPACQFLDPLL